MRMYDIIQKKKMGEALSEEEIRFFVDGVTDGSIPDYAASALLMAICFQGMNMRETVSLTHAMMHSGDTVDLSAFGSRSVDKHSTGGVGDKTTLILAPIVSAVGAVVAKMSGRGLGFTGGTVDKMESIPGMRVDLSAEEFLAVTQKVGLCVVGQSASLAPADKKLYALRDATATVESIPLIASSIMSKKLASGAQNIVLDVKFGRGAFMKTPEEATCLAQTMVRIGTELGRKVRAVVTDMDVPLGSMIGNALEVKEAVEVLRGQGDGRLRRICLTLASHMISLSLSLPFDEAEKRVEDALTSGKAREQMKEWIRFQGGDPMVVENPSLLPQAPFTQTVVSPEEGFLSAMHAEKVGHAAMLLGAGRKRKDDAIDPAAGIELLRGVGDRVKKGESIAVLYSSRKETFEEAREMFLSALSFASVPREPKPLIYRLIEA